MWLIDRIKKYRYILAVTINHYFYFRVIPKERMSPFYMMFMMSVTIIIALGLGIGLGILEDWYAILVIPQFFFATYLGVIINRKALIIFRPLSADWGVEE